MKHFTYKCVWLVQSRYKSSNQSDVLIGKNVSEDNVYNKRVFKEE